MNDRLKRDAESALSDLISEIERLEEENTELECKIGRLTKENEELSDTIAAQDDTIADLESQIKESAKEQVVVVSDNEDYKLY